MIRVHPETGQKALYVNSSGTVRILGLGADESASLLAELYDRVRRPELQFRHRWQVGQIVACDNGSTMPTATVNSQPTARRTLYRLTIGANRRESAKQIVWRGRLIACGVVFWRCIDASSSSVTRRRS